MTVVLKKREQIVLVQFWAERKKINKKEVARDANRTGWWEERLFSSKEFLAVPTLKFFKKENFDVTALGPGQSTCRSLKRPYSPKTID